MIDGVKKLIALEEQMACSAPAVFAAPPAATVALGGPLLCMCLCIFRGAQRLLMWVCTYVYAQIYIYYIYLSVYIYISIYIYREREG